MKVERKIDWLAVTLPADTQPEDTLVPDGWIRSGKGLHGWRNRLEHPTGMVCQTDSADKKMGTHLALSGDSLTNLRSLGFTDDKMIEVLISRLSGRASRIDLAITLTDCTITPKTLSDAIKSGSASAKTRTSALVSSRSGAGIQGSTLYLGSRQSERFLRFYDKNAEQNIVSQSAKMRLELELKGIMAHMCGKAMVENGTDKVIIGHFSDFLDWNDTEYQLALTGDSVSPQKTERKATNTEKWLLETCAPALARVCEVNTEFMNDFIKAFNMNSEPKK